VLGLNELSPQAKFTNILLLAMCDAVQGDKFLDASGVGGKVIPFWRSGFVRSDDGKGTREAQNLITHYLDASMVCVAQTT
jgi:hypothetical protein